MNCVDFQEIISASLDGEISSQEKTSLQTHLLRCPDCRKALEELQETKSLIKSLGRMEAPSTLRPKIQARIEDEKIIFIDFKKFLRPALAAVAMVALFLGSVSLLGYFSSEKIVSKDINFYMGNHAYHLMQQPLADHSSWSMVAGESAFSSIAAEE